MISGLIWYYGLPMEGIGFFSRRRIMVLLYEFFQDKQGRKHLQLKNDLDFIEIVSFFNRFGNDKCMVEAMTLYNRPPIYLFIKELESKYDLSSVRLRQAIGILVRLHMAKIGRIPTGKYKSLKSVSKYYSKFLMYKTDL